MKKILFLFVLLLATMASWAQMLTPRIDIKDLKTGEKSIEISQIKVDVKVVGALAVTTVDMTFYNPNTRVMEGELEFPLADGQSISRFALDINGKLREGVTVDKAKGQKAFESIVRRGVDPGLLEKTSGNNFRTRVYPLTARSTRRVVIAYEQELKADNGKYQFFLPVEYRDKIGDFSVNLVVHGKDQQPKVDETPWGNFSFSQSGEAYMASYSMKDYKGKGQIVFSVPVKNDIQLYVERGKIGKQTVFYTQLFPEVVQKEKSNPKSIALFWDASSSMSERNFDLESQLLDRYFGKFKNLSVNLYKFNYKELKSQRFTIKNGDWSQLKTALKETIYDGGTQLGALNLSSVKADEILFFSDGLSNFGKVVPLIGQTPITTINSMLKADYSMLKYLASTSGGTFVNLMQQTVDEVMAQLNSESLRLIDIDYNKNEVEDITTSGTIINARQGISIAGKLKSGSAIITLKFGNGKRVSHTERVSINSSAAADYDNMVERLWAAKRIAELDMLYDENKRDIERLGKKYNIVTRNTSLIVLETVGDYIEHDITPPEELREEYYRIRKDMDKSRAIDVEERINNAIQLWDYRKKWWNEEPKKEYAIHGTIKDEKGSPLPATVQLEGRLAKKVQASYDGHFYIKAFKNDKLAFMLDGYQSQSMTVKGDEKVSIVLKANKPAKVVDKGYEPPKVEYTIRTGGSGDYTITGVVKEKSIDEPLVGVSIVIKGTNQGVVSDIDGRFSIKANRGEAIQFFYVGFKTESITVDGDATVEIRMEENAQHLDEVVVSGYGEVRRDELFASAIEIEATDMVSEALYDMAPGVAVERSKAKEEEVAEESRGTISIKAWESDAPYMEELKEKSNDELYAAYLVFKKDYQTAPSFYLDVASLFETRGLKEDALLILSNLAEMKLDDYRLLRVLAHRLQQLGYFEYAIPMFEKVKELRPEEPQSFRDLGLAYAENKEYQKAIDELYEVIVRRWDGRFREIEVFAVEEINNIIAKGKKSLDISKIDERLIFNMPVDVRIVLNWDTDNTDMDLWVTDPNDEKCYYSNPKTKALGMITRDYRDGYGPEAFLIKKAPKGKYVIAADYFGTNEQTLIGPTTIYLDVFTHYGTPQETKKTIMLRLEEAQGEVEIGEIEF